MKLQQLKKLIYGFCVFFGFCCTSSTYTCKYLKHYYCSVHLKYFKYLYLQVLEALRNVIDLIF